MLKCLFITIIKLAPLSSLVVFGVCCHL